jgi:thymidine phosphorylase
MCLCAELLVQSNLANDIGGAMTKLQKSLDTGKALEIFAKMISKLGVPNDFVEKPEKYLPKANIIQPLFSPQPGYIQGMNTRNIGLSVIELKGGRSHPEQKIDHATGYSGFCQVGDYVDADHPIAYIHAQTDDDYNAAAEALFHNIVIGEEQPAKTPTILETVE